MRQEVIDLLKKVETMRSAQKRYFKSRNPQDLIVSKKLETQVDTEVPALLNRLTTPSKP